MRKLAIRASGLVVAVAVSATLGAIPALPASAATGVGVVEVSDDGVTFAQSYPGVIFDDIAKLTPGDSQSDTIYLRNTGTTAGYLRITLRDVNYSDQAFADALTVTTSVTGGSGGATAISSAAPCAVTNEGVIVAPGQTVSVLATLALGNLNGSAGQSATASASLRFTLSDTTPGSLPATTCSATGTTVPVAPAGSGSAGATGITSSVATKTSAGTLTVPSPSPSMTWQPSEASGSGLLPALPSTFSLDPNTWRLYQEYLVLILVFAAMIGAGISWLVGRRSRKDAEDV